MSTVAPARPTVLLADDYLPFLEIVSRLLTRVFDVVAMASNGRQALDLARRFKPDVVVLDIAMPDLDGLQTLKQLRRDDPETRVVFLTMHRDDELVAAAIKDGAYGYVLKSRTHVDLIGAIEHALAERLFVPSLTSLTTLAEARHAVQFHADDSRYLDDVSQFVGATLRAGEQIVMVTSEATRMGVAERLRARQMNLELLSEQGQYVTEDSALAVSQMMIDGWPDRARVAEIINGLDHLRLAFQKRPDGRLTIFGDMAVALCRDGNFEAVLELERIWNELTRTRPFLTVCSYPSDCFKPEEGRRQLPNVCNAHGAVTVGSAHGRY